MPEVDSSGKEFWSVDLEEWVYERGTGDENEWKPTVKGHMLHSTVEKDDDGNLYLVWTFADEDCWMIGKKERGWNMGIETEGDKRRLKLTDLLAEQVVPGGGGLPQMPIERDTLKEREKLGLERMVSPRSYLGSGVYWVIQLTRSSFFVRPVQMRITFSAATAGSTAVRTSTHGTHEILGTAA